MKNKSYIKLIAACIALLLAYIVLYFIDRSFAGNAVVGNVIQIAAIIVMIPGIITIICVVNSGGFKDWLATVDEFYSGKKEEKQITLRQMINFDVVMAVIGSILLAAWRTGPTLFAIAAIIKDVVFYVSIFYVVVLFVAVFYTYLVVKEYIEEK